MWSDQPDFISLRAGTRAFISDLACVVSRVTPRTGKRHALQAALRVFVRITPACGGRDMHPVRVRFHHFGTPPRTGTRRRQVLRGKRILRITPAHGDER